jgi:hypothetical protein
LIGISKMSFYKYKNELLAEVGAAAQTITWKRHKATLLSPTVMPAFKDVVEASD